MGTPLNGSCQCGAVEPEVHMWTLSKQSWLTLPANARQFETQPEDPMELLQAALDYRAYKAAISRQAHPYP